MSFLKFFLNTVFELPEKLLLTSVDPEFQSIITCVVEVSLETNRNFDAGFKGNWIRFIWECLKCC